MPTYNEIISDIAVALGFTHDDSLLGRNALGAIVINAENKLSGQDLANDLGPASNGVAAQDRLTTFPAVPVIYTENTNDVEWAHHYVILPAAVHDIANGAGIGFVRYHRPSIPINCPPSVARATFTQTSLGSLSALYDHPMQRPSPSQPYFCRALDNGQERIYIFGMDPQVSKLLLGLYVANSYLTVDFNSEIRLPPARIFDLKRLAMQMSFWSMTIPQERLKNDGRDMEPGQQVNAPPIISVNDPAMVSNIPQQ
jgi:hypothetical protein